MKYEIRLSEKEHTKFCNVMHERLKKEGISVKEFSEQLGVKPQSIYNFENDKTRNPSKFLAAKIANALKIESKDYKTKSSFFCLIPLMIILCIPVKANAYEPTEITGERVKNESQIPLSEEHQVAIKEICEEKELSYPVVLALMEKESNFKADAVSPDGKNLGICQIHKSFFECDDYFDVIQNVDSATDYLQVLMKKYEDYEKALTKYNGQNAAKSKYSSWILERSNYYESII